MAVKKTCRFYLTQPDVGIQKMLINRGYEIVMVPEKAQVFLFPGGSDVIPILYGEKPIPGTNYSLTRDLKEVKFFRCIPRSMPKIGICRGSQFLNVMCGGSLWQDVDGHLGPHEVWDAKLKANIPCTSTHHQMMIPPSHARVLGWANESTRKENAQEVMRISPDKPVCDPEVVWFKDEHTLCFQPHPEYGVTPCEDYFFHLLDNYIFNRI